MLAFALEVKRALKNKPELQIQSILEMADRMMVISEGGLASREDDGCVLLNGLVREWAYRLRKAAERELIVHYDQERRNVGQ